MRSALRATWTVARRELVEALREVHVLVFSLGFPLLFYPLLFFGGIQLASMEQGLAERNPPRVSVEGPAAVVDALTQDPIERASPADPAAALADGDVDLVVQATEGGDALSVEVAYASTRPRSNEGRFVLDDQLDALEDERQAAVEERLGLDEGALSPWGIDVEDEAPAGRTLASLLGMAVPMILLVSMMLAGVYPAVEVVVGERERGTLETTLLSAAPRGAIAAGKVVAVMALLMLSTLGSGAAMGLTVVTLVAQLDPDGDSGVTLDWLQIAATTPLLLVTAALAAAVLCLAALPTRTFRQGQSAVSTVATALMMPAMIGVMPAIDLSWGLACVPVANAVLVLRDAIGGEGIDLGTLALACAVNAGLAAVILAVAGRIVSSEGWLFAGDVPVWLRWLDRENR